MDQDTMALLIGLIGTVMVTGLLGCAIAGAYFFGRSRGPRQPGAFDEASSAARLARLERLLEGLSVEIERIGEAQRYAARVADPRRLSTRTTPVPDPRVPTRTPTS